MFWLPALLSQHGPELFAPSVVPMASGPIPRWHLLTITFTLLWLLNTEHLSLFLPLSEPNKPTRNSNYSCTPANSHISTQHSIMWHKEWWSGMLRRELSCALDAEIPPKNVEKSEGVWLVIFVIQSPARLWTGGSGRFFTTILLRSCIFREVLRNLPTANFCLGNRNGIESSL